MNIKRTLTTFGLAIGLLLGISGVAQAASYDCDGGSNPVPTNVSGDVDIVASGACTISHSVTATGNINILATGDLTVTGSLTSGLNDAFVIELKAADISIGGGLFSGGAIRAEATSDNIRVIGDVTANTGNFNGNVLLIAQKNIGTGNIVASGTTSFSGVEIAPNQGGANTLFTIGGSGHTNGVNGTIDVSSVSGGGNSGTTVKQGIFISNGGTNATGGITVTDGSNLKVGASNSRAGLIILDAKKGTLTISAGTLTAKGAANKQAGLISLLAQTIAFGPDVTVDLSQDSGSPASYHALTLAASSVTYSGSSGLTLKADGNGNSYSQSANVRLMPTGGLTATSNRNVFFLNWTQAFPNTPWGTNAPLNITGAGSSPLNLTADGKFGGVYFSGSSVNLAGGNLTAQARGENTEVIVYFVDGGDPFTTHIEVNNTGTVKFDAGGVSASGGRVLVYSSDIAINNASTFTVSANGPTSGNGDGGVIDFQTITSFLATSTKAKFTADAASAGTGNAIYADPLDDQTIVAINFISVSVASPIDIGTNNGQFSFSANGGANGGNAGSMRILTDANVNLRTAQGISASALTGNGDGGWVWLSNINTVVENDSSITLNGKGTGVGGRFVSANLVTGNWAVEWSFDINRNISVDGGSSLLSSSENDYGSIELSGAMCQQRTTGQTAWPYAYWNCVNPSASTAQDQVQVNLAKSSAYNGIRSLLETKKVNLYVFPNGAAYNNFFHTAAPAVAGGVTTRLYLAGTIVSTAWLEGSIGSNTVITFSANQLKEVSAHELGHAADISHLESNDSQSALFNNYLVRDYDTLDFADLSQPIPIRRLPCVRTINPAHPSPLDPLHFYPGQAPFANAMWLQPNNTSVPVCTVSPITGALVINPAISLNPLISNHEVMEIIEPHIWPAAADTDLHWLEAHAHSFGYATVGNLGATPNTNQILDKGYFPCIVSWGNSERGGALPTSACTLSPQ